MTVNCRCVLIGMECEMSQELEDLVSNALSDYCTECNGTGRDAFTVGILWCVACKGKGTRISQIEKQAEDLKLKQWRENKSSQDKS